MNDRQQSHVLVVGINYAPEHTGIAPYTTAAAEHLAAGGHRVEVLAGVPHYPAWTVPGAYRWRLSQTRVVGGVTLRRLRHFVPKTQDAIRRGLYELSFAVHVAIRGRSVKPDVVIAVVPSLLSGLVASWIARRSGAAFVVWIQDLMGAASAQSGISGGHRVASLVGKAERAVLAQAGSVLVASDAFRRYVEEAGVPAEQITTMPNWVHVAPPEGDPLATRAGLAWAKDQVIVLHTGNMGLKQDLKTVVDAARLASQQAPTLRFVLMGEGSQRSDLEHYAQGVQGLTLMAPADHDAYSDVLRAADILLVNERQGMVDMSLPSKLTSYFTSGRPVVAAVHRNGGTAAEVARSRGGIVTETQTPQGLLDSVLLLVHDPERARQLGERGQEYAAEELSADASLHRLDQLVERASVLVSAT